MASIEKRPDGRWRARWREYAGGPQKARHFPRKIDAEQFLDGIRGDLVRGTYVDPDAGRITFRAFAEDWRRSAPHRDSTAQQVESYLRLHAYPTLGERPLAEIRPSHVQAWVRRLSDRLAPGSVEIAYRWVSTIFGAAVRDRRIAISPCSGVSLPRRERRRLDVLTVEQVMTHAAAMPDRWQALVLTMAGTGLRPGEARGVTVDRLDMLRRSVTVDRQLVGVAAGLPTFGPPKTEASSRSVPLPQVIVDVLAEHLARFGPGVEGLVFTNTEGRPVRRQTMADAWNRAAKVSGLPKWATPHDLRHHYASLLIHRGLSVKAVQSHLGHESAVITLDTYGHLWPDSDEDTRSAVDDAFAAAEDQLRTEGGTG